VLQNANRTELVIAHLDSELGGEIPDKDLACIVAGACIQLAWVAKSHDDVCSLDLLGESTPDPVCKQLHIYYIVCLINECRNGWI
jgi:hypothetical protein